MGLGDFITNISQDISSAVNALANLGIQCPEYIIQLFLNEGSDPVQEISKLYHEITSAGHDCIAFFDMLVIGCQQYGSPQAYLRHLAKQLYAQMAPCLEDMVNVWGASASLPVDMVAEIDALIAQHPGFGTMPGSQGLMASAFMERYADIKTNISKMAMPMSSSPSSPWEGKDYGRNLRHIWNDFAYKSQQRIESEIQDGSLWSWRLPGVFVCAAGFAYADVILTGAAAALAGVSVGASVPVGLGLILGWDLAMISIAMRLLNILDLFILMLVKLIDLLVVVAIADPLTWLAQQIHPSIAVPAHPDWTLPDGRELPNSLRGTGERLYNDPRIINAFPNAADRMVVITWLLIAFVANCGYSVTAIQQLLEAADFVPGLAHTVELASKLTGGSYQEGAFRVLQTILSLPFIPDFAAQYGTVTPFNVVGVGVQEFGANGQTLGDVDLQIKAKGQLLYAEVGGSNKGGDLRQQEQFISELTKLKAWATRDSAKPICFLTEPNPRTQDTGYKDWTDFETAVSIAKAQLGPDNVFIVPYADHRICQP